MELFQYNLTLHLPQDLPDQIFVANTINPHSYCVAKEDAEFQKALINSDLLFPDGVGVVWASKFLKGKEIKKISGFDLHLHYLRILDSKGGGKVFYLGSSERTLVLIQDRLKKEFPSILVGFYSPPFKPDFSKEENRKMLEAIHDFGPDILFVGMTAPKQEKWVAKNKGQIKAKVVCSIGAVFDFYAGTVKRPSQFWIDLGLEWFPRFIKEPRRLWRRNLISTPQFIFDVLRAKLGQ
ncbi:WecB/TagA/CpsF family glycosyltransferase [Algoriphagus sanaruensis]|uniref:N-acetylglucosaminyldiphospho-UDPN-acetyl-beta-D-mannosaminyltransferase n=1 Tax=Algoriphagus sanaruensis TaxID=1727163 RepID=A0A142EQW4_9BACT|nr:WecB/TagA/CpsF family glycosyltransferase [Algoriphagus sanaruensis]AMQ57519.1 N-acetylglucosaminyldiphospho-UDPN-acetyl-beta-D-mannosaminyltransferase [Algoriphagus sanaruensis]